LLQTEFGRLLGCGLGCSLGRERRALAATFESDGAGRGEAESVTIGICNGDYRVVESRFDVRHAATYITPRLAFLALRHESCSSDRTCLVGQASRLSSTGGDAGPTDPLPSHVVPSRPSCRQPSYAGPCGCGRWSWFSGREPATLDDA